MLRGSWTEVRVRVAEGEGRGAVKFRDEGVRRRSCCRLCTTCLSQETLRSGGSEKQVRFVLRQFDFF